MGAEKNVQSCMRCGVCCQKGGPAFHWEDKALIENGAIQTRYLFTIRKGEKVRDTIADRLTTANAELIKMKGRPPDWTCCFFDAAEKSCTIYENRPLECRSLTCWDPTEIRRIYARNRLTRKELLQNVQGLWELIEDHEQRCSYAKMGRAIADLEGNFRKTAVKAVMEMVRYDMELRNLVVERGGMASDMTDFLFGRPFTATLSMYGYQVKIAGGKYSLVHD
jgi:Fe-S-cluster containining protein